MQTHSRSQALLTAFTGFLGSPLEFFKSLDMGHAGVLPTIHRQVQEVTLRRAPHSHCAERLNAGIPHGYSGAKLARKALAGRISLRG